MAHLMCLELKKRGFDADKVQVKVKGFTQQYFSNSNKSELPPEMRELVSGDLTHSAFRKLMTAAENWGRR